MTKVVSDALRNGIVIIDGVLQNDWEEIAAIAINALREPNAALTELLPQWVDAPVNLSSVELARSMMNDICDAALKSDEVVV